MVEMKKELIQKSDMINILHAIADIWINDTLLGKSVNKKWNDDLNTLSVIYKGVSVKSFNMVDYSKEIITFLTEKARY